MKLYVRTASGTGLGIDVLLTGRVKEANDAITSVEIYMPTGGHVIVGYRVEPQPKGRGSSEILWVDPSDLCTRDGDRVNQEALHAEIARVHESLAYEKMYGPLGKDWP